MITVKTNAGEVAKYMASGGLALDATISRLTLNAGRRLLTSVRRHASGGEGPEVETGDYRSSWKMSFTKKDLTGASVANVGTDSPQGARLEYGFHGADALGRVVDQPPQPHVEPALAEVVPRFVADMEAAVALWVGKPGG